MKKVLSGLVIAVGLVMVVIMINNKYSKIDKVDEYCMAIEETISQEISEYVRKSDKLKLLEAYDPKIIEKITKPLDLELFDLPHSDEAWVEYQKQMSSIRVYLNKHEDDYVNIINIYSSLCK